LARHSSSFSIGACDTIANAMPSSASRSMLAGRLSTAHVQLGQPSSQAGANIAFCTTSRHLSLNNSVSLTGPFGPVKE
jgi:hypothetical protein